MFYIIFGLLISSIYSFCILPDNEGSEPSVKLTAYPIFYKGMFIIPYNQENAIHLHHWVVYYFICLIRNCTYLPDLLLGFSLGLFVQGITYKDSLYFICNNPYS